MPRFARSLPRFFSPPMLPMLVAAVLGGASPDLAEAVSITRFAVSTTSGTPGEITPAPDGNLWFTESTANQIGRITLAGVVTEFALPAANSRSPGGTASWPRTSTPTRS